MNLNRRRIVIWILIRLKNSSNDFLLLLHVYHYYDQKETYTYSKYEEYRGIKISNKAKQPFTFIPDVIDTTRVKRVEIRIWKTERIGVICLMRLSRQIYQ